MVGRQTGWLRLAVTDGMGGGKWTGDSVGWTDYIAMQDSLLDRRECNGVPWTSSASLPIGKCSCISCSFSSSQAISFSTISVSSLAFSPALLCHIIFFFFLPAQ